MAYKELEGKVALITGASRGIGSAVAREFVRSGARVGINYSRSPEPALRLKAELGDYAHIVRADVSSFDQTKSMVQEITSKFGRLDVLVNNAGVTSLMSLENYNELKFEQMWKTNFMGTLYSTLSSLARLKESKGCIINVASNSAIGTNTPTQGTTFYAVTKAAMVLLTKRSAVELGVHGIRVNAVAPGWVKTDMVLSRHSEEELESLEREYRARSSLGEVVAPEHVAKAILFLASKGAESITGQVITIDAGRTDYLSRSA